MKKLNLILLLLVFAGSTAFAQFGIQAGVLKTSNSVKIDGKDSQFKPDGIIGFQFGIVYDMPISDNLVFNTGLLYTVKGSQVDLEVDILGTKSKTEAKTTINYIELPINIKYKTEMGLFFKGGPYLAYAISGKNKLKTTVTTSNTDKVTEKTDDVKFGSNASESKAMDFGLNLGAGMKFGNIEVALGYALGLANLSNADKTVSKGNAISLTAAYYFGE